MPFDAEELRSRARDLVSGMEEAISSGNYGSVLDGIHNLTREYLINEAPSTATQLKILSIVIAEANKLKDRQVMMGYLLAAETKSKLAGLFAKQDENLATLLAIGRSIWQDGNADTLLKQLIDLNSKRSKLSKSGGR